MGLFSNKHEQVPVQQTAPPRNSTSSVNGERRGLFNRRNSPDQVPVQTQQTNGHSSGLFHRRNSPDQVPVQTAQSNGHSGGLFHRNTHDPSIVQAKQRVADAELAERNADRALIQARAAVRDARNDIKRLEREAAEEARLAKIKQHEAAGISKSAKHLGRHGVQHN